MGLRTHQTLKGVNRLG